MELEALGYVEKEDGRYIRKVSGVEVVLTKKEWVNVYDVTSLPIGIEKIDTTVLD